MKTRIRNEIKREIEKIKPEEREKISDLIFLQIEQLPEFKSAKTILLFWSLPDEVSTHLFINKWYKEKRILLPVVNGDILDIKTYTNENNMKCGCFHILEPLGKPFVQTDKIDLTIVPGVGFDKQGNRLGRGKGFYDKLLPSIPGIKIGVCFPCQLVAEIPCQHWDIKMDKVITASLRLQ